MRTEFSDTAYNDDWLLYTTHKGKIKVIFGWVDGLSVVSIGVTTNRLESSFARYTTFPGE
jgi:hypothetical protein